MTKVCTKCKVEKPMTTEYFSRMKDGFQFQCKECKKRYHEKNKEEINKLRNEKYRLEHPIELLPEGMKKCCKCKEVKPSTNDFFNASKNTKDGFKHACKECRKLEYKNDSERIIKKSRKYYQDNKEKVSVINKRYKQKNREWYRNYDKEYYKENEKLIKKRSTKYYHENKDNIVPKMKIYGAKWSGSQHGKLLKRFYQQKRTATKLSLLNTLTLKEWEGAKAYFEQSCAYCGKGETELHQEHVIPMSKGGAYNKQNIIPSCQPCNNKKWAHDMEKWYMLQEFFSKERLSKIHKWIGCDTKNKAQQLSIL